MLVWLVCLGVVIVLFRFTVILCVGYFAIGFTWFGVDVLSGVGSSVCTLVTFWLLCLALCFAITGLVWRL